MYSDQPRNQPKPVPLSLEEMADALLSRELRKDSTGYSFTVRTVLESLLSRFPTAGGLMAFVTAIDTLASASSPGKPLSHTERENCIKVLKDGSEVLPSLRRYYQQLYDKGDMELLDSYRRPREIMTEMKWGQNHHEALLDFDWDGKGHKRDMRGDEEVGLGEHPRESQKDISIELKYLAAAIADLLAIEMLTPPLLEAAQASGKSL